MSTTNKSLVIDALRGIAASAVLLLMAIMEILLTLVGCRNSRDTLVCLGLIFSSSFLVTLFGLVRVRHYHLRGVQGQKSGHNIEQGA